MDRRNVKYWWRYLVVVAWMVVIFRFSTEAGDASSGRSDIIVHWLQGIGIPGSGETLGFLVRKAAHMAEYAVLALLSFYALRAHIERGRALLWSFGVTVVYAISDEIHQLFVPGRTGSPRDVLVDALGAAIGLALAAWFSTWQEPTQPELPDGPAT